MNKKIFKKPSIPMNLTQVADPIDLLEEVYLPEKYMCEPEKLDYSRRGI